MVWARMSRASLTRSCFEPGVTGGSCLALYVFLANFERAAIETTFPSSRGKNFKLLSVLVGGSKVR